MVVNINDFTNANTETNVGTENDAEKSRVNNLHGAQGIEVSPSMVDAGASALAGYGMESETLEEAVTRIYVEMEKARTMAHLLKV
jgi:hypothetical protein